MVEEYVIYRYKKSRLSDAKKYELFCLTPEICSTGTVVYLGLEFLFSTLNNVNLSIFLVVLEF
jgi:hypothetical protein